MAKPVDWKAYLVWGFIGIIVAYIFLYLAARAYYPWAQQSYSLIAVIAGVGGALMLFIGFLNISSGE
jgi:hypothetical protein